MFLMNLMSERMSSGSAVRTTCDMKKEATPETLCTLLPPLLRRSRKQMQPRRTASTPGLCTSTSSSAPLSILAFWFIYIVRQCNTGGSGGHLQPPRSSVEEGIVALGRD